MVSHFPAVEGPFAAEVLLQCNLYVCARVGVCMYVDMGTGMCVEFFTRGLVLTQRHEGGGEAQADAKKGCSCRAHACVMGCDERMR